MKKKIKIISITILATTILCMVLAFVFKDNILQYGIKKVQNKFKNQYQTDLQIGKAELKGLSELELKNIYLIPNKADTLVAIQTFKTKIDVLEIITGTIQVNNLEIKNGFIQLVKNKNGRNFDTFLKRDPNEKGASTKNYAKTAYRLLSKILNLVPTEMSLTNLSLRIVDMNRKVQFKMTNLLLSDKNLKSKIEVLSKDLSQNWTISGVADPRAMKADLVFKNLDTTNIVIPYIDERFGLHSSFKNIRLKLDLLDYSGSELHIDGVASIENLTVNHPKIANKDVVINNAEFDYRFLLGSDFIALDSTSQAVLNNVRVIPFLEYNTEEDTIYKMKIKIPETKAQDFIESLPKGLFTHFEGMEAKGNFSYSLDFEYNKNKPHQLVFDSQLTKKQLQITKYGEANLEKLNSEFEYAAIENGRKQRAVFVGLSNPNYTPIDQIPNNLKNAILTSEDPSFFRHRGFITEAFKQSIIKNIRTKKFARGASTISMQIIKNVFLTREKTLSRKLEEILLVYILENNRIATKDRMFEVYCNIIEWGPDIYGIGEAAQFYFQKKPMELTLNECLFLATIIPKPKKFSYQFDQEGNLKKHVNQQQNLIKNLMFKRGLITPNDTIGQNIPLFISGSARNQLRIVPKDTISVDTLAVLN